MDESSEPPECRPVEGTLRIGLTLRKPWLGWYPKPTVVIDGRGNPAQWGSGTWRVPSEGTIVIAVFLYNRLWRFGEAEITLDRDGPSTATYTAPRLPFLRGRLRLTTR